MRRLLPPAAVLLALMLSAPTASAARGGAPVDAGGWAVFLHRPGKAPAWTPGPRFDRYEQVLVLDEPEALERRVTFRVTWPEGARPDTVDVVEIDTTLRETCAPTAPEGGAGDGAGAGAVVDPEDPEEADAAAGPSVEVVPLGSGLDGRAMCSVRIPLAADAEGSFEGGLVVRRPRVDRLEDRFAVRVPVQPPALGAEHLSFSVEYLAGAPPRIDLIGWGADVRVQELDRGRRRSFVELARVHPHPAQDAVRSLAGRVPEIAVTSGESWDDVALDHRLQYRAAARATGSVLRMAGRVLAKGEAVASVVEAARIALDETTLDPAEGAGGTWRLPQSAQYTLDEKRGTAADRAALLLSLLKTADLRAEIVLASSRGADPHPDRPIAALDRTLVFVPGVHLRGEDPLFIDPSLSAAWLGALDERLAGRPAILLAPEGARWLRLPAELPPSTWSLRGIEREDGSFDVSVQGRLQGGTAARLREWDLAGRPAEAIPARDLLWLAGEWGSRMEIAVEAADHGVLLVTATGVLPRAVVVPGGRLPVPRTPGVVSGSAQRRRLAAIGVDTDGFSIEIKESWRFRGRRPGSASPVVKRTTPFWAIRSFGNWTGPLFNRESSVRWSGQRLSPNAAGEVERFQEELAALFDSVQAPRASGAAAP